VYVSAPENTATAPRPASVTLQTPLEWDGMADNMHRFAASEKQNIFTGEA